MASVRISLIPIAWRRAARLHLRIEPEIFFYIVGFIFAASFCIAPAWIRNKTDLHWVEDIVPAIKNCGTFGAWVQQISQRRYRTVVQIGRPQPDAVQRQIYIAKSFAEMTEAPRITGVERILHRS